MPEIYKGSRTMTLAIFPVDLYMNSLSISCCMFSSLATPYIPIYPRRIVIYPPS